MSSLCVSTFSACFSAKGDKPRDRVSHHGVEREMNILYQQPHLVEPMKLRVYEDLPSTPLTTLSSSLPQWQIFPSRNTASRASSRASRFSLKKKLSRPSISKPMPVPDSANDLPFRRRQQYRPLELSVYMEEDRLSSLPEFDRLSFTELGELKLPPKALVRTLSEQIPPAEVQAITSSHKPASMFEIGQTSPTRPTTAYSIISTSRPPSEYEALHSHPVSWSGLLGMANSNKKIDNSVVDILTPMQEEFSPGISAVMADATALTSPEKCPATIIPATETTSVPPDNTVSATAVESEPLHSNKSKAQTKENSVPPYFHTNYQTQKRISQWLAYRAQSSSTTTVESTSTTTSFAEHRRKRSEFYQLGKQPPIPSASPPEPLQLARSNSPRSHHQRTVTASTADSSVGTEVLSFGFTARSSEDSMTTMSAADLMSRQGTVKSVVSPGGHTVTMAQVQDLGFNLPLHCEADVVEEEEILYLEEINGPLRSPGVGIAF